MLTHVQKKYKTITRFIDGFRRFRAIFIQEEGRAVARKNLDEKIFKANRDLREAKSRDFKFSKFKNLDLTVLVQALL